MADAQTKLIYHHTKADHAKVMDNLPECTHYKHIFRIMLLLHDLMYCPHGM